MTNSTHLLVAILSILCCHHASAQTETPPIPPQTSTGDQDTQISSTMVADPESTRVASTFATSVQSNQLKPESEGLEWGAEPTTSRVLITRTMSLTSTIDHDTASETTSPTQPASLIPVEAVTESQRPQNTTTTQSSLSTRSSTSTNTLTSTIYVLQPSPTISQIAGPEATESASWLEKSGVSDPGSKANIAAIGLGAGFGAILLVVMSIMAMWMLHRRGGRKENDRDEDGSSNKLERQSVER